MSDEAIIIDEPATNGDAPVDERDELIRQQAIAITVLRQRMIELELELCNTRCELASRDG